eukprot:6210642-Pleurochrysis_carterae.AAC.2
MAFAARPSRLTPKKATSLFSSGRLRSSSGFTSRSTPVRGCVRAQLFELLRWQSAGLARSTWPDCAATSRTDSESAAASWTDFASQTNESIAPWRSRPICV